MLCTYLDELLRPRGSTKGKEHGMDMRIDLGGRGRGEEKEISSRERPGIVIRDGAHEDQMRPRMAAFIWGGKVRPVPTLPFGRWKGAA
jgi:hypothetical protein